MTTKGGVGASGSVTPAIYPKALLDWGGNRSGGVRRLFDDRSGRPVGDVIETPLIRRLRNWARAFGTLEERRPRIVLLVGGPGNGKTEAIEATIRELDDSLGCGGRLVEHLAMAFKPTDGKVPRRIKVDTKSIGAPTELTIEVVQDATVETNGVPAGHLLVSELISARRAGSRTVYLCCVNRGVLDDALIHAIETGNLEARDLLETVTQAVSLGPDTPSCWPLSGYEDVAVWPMDAETLIESPEGAIKSPAALILGWAIDAAHWPELGSCAAGTLCPFCTSRSILAGRREFEALLQMLRWFELGSGKRWAFRDLFSLVSFLLAGSGAGKQGLIADPCLWAAELVEANEKTEKGATPSRDLLPAIFYLTAAQYQHALFHKWDSRSASTLRQDIKDLKLADDHTATGLLYFVQSRKLGYLPAAIEGLLASFVDLLDPALASPDARVVLWGASDGIKLREFDERFSRSVQDGLDLAISHRALSRIERNLLHKLAELDAKLASSSIRRRRPTSAIRLQRYIRDFAGRVFRRSVGARQAIVPDMETFSAFQKVVADANGSGHELGEVARQVEELLNQGDRFEVSLTTTFGQPLPPERARAMLVVSRRNVLPRDIDHRGRPPPALRFLDVGLNEAFQPIALTFELFKAVKDLSMGLSPASLSRSVLALLDTTRARMAGAIVRERIVQERPRIILGGNLEITKEHGKFVSRRRGR